MSDSKSNANAAILATNGLRYIMPKPLSTTLVRTYKKQYSQRQTYTPADTIVFDLNVSGQVDPEMSYLTFKFKPDNDALFTSNGACSLIRDIRIQSKNGVELDRIQSFNAWSWVWVNNEVDLSKLNTEKNMTLFNEIVTAGQTVQVVLPMKWLSGLFRPHVKGQKIPSHMLSGARIEIVLENVNRALIQNPGQPAPTIYSIENPSIVLMEHTCNDNTLKVLTEESANNGLEYVYDRVFTSIETTNANILHTQIKKAVSQATKIVTSVHDPGKQSSITDNSFSGLSPTGGVFSKFQYRLASNYFPHQPVDNVNEAYKVTRGCFDSNKSENHYTNNSLFNYSSGGATFAVGVPLQTDNSISSSGLAVNNSATVALEYEGDGSNKIYYTFLVYTALARTFLNQVTVKI